MTRQVEYQIIEEVPGVPKEEAYFISGPGIDYNNPLRYASSVCEAKRLCEKQGWVPYEVIHFEP